MSQRPTNRQPTSALTTDDVDAAITRLGDRDEAIAREAEHIVDSLTWGEGPGVIRQSGLQQWLWYIVPTKYMTDEVGYMQRLASCAAELFDELGLHGYAALCRSDETAKVHSAFDRSDEAGRVAMRKAMERSGVSPPDLEDFRWSPVMGIYEAQAQSMVEHALEDAIDAGRMIVGARGWRGVQAQVAAEALDSDHDEWPNQTWRMAVITERLERWVSQAERRCPAVAAARAAVSNRLLAPIAPPPGAPDSVRPLMWLLDRWGDEQPLTQAGYLKPAFVKSLQPDKPWSRGEFERDVNKENDDFTLHELRGWLQQAGALRKRKATLQRTKLGAAMASDSDTAWQTLIANMGGDSWQGFVAETALLRLLVADTGKTDGENARDGATTPSAIALDGIREFVRSAAGDMGWATTERGVRSAPSARDVSWTLAEVKRTWLACNLLEDSGDWGNRQTRLTNVGRAAALAFLRQRSAGPHDTL